MKFTAAAEQFLQQERKAAEWELRLTAHMQEAEKLGFVKHIYQDEWMILDVDGLNNMRKKS